MNRESILVTRPSAPVPSSFLLQRKCYCGEPANGRSAYTDCGGNSEKTAQRSTVSANSSNWDGVSQPPFFARNDFSRISTETTPRLQRSALAIGRPGDRFEQEADRVANSMSAEENSHETPIEPDDIAAALHETDEPQDLNPQVPNEPARRLRSARGSATVRAREHAGETPAVSIQDEQSLGKLGGGQPLAESSRAFFEPRFGHDFSNVRVHTGLEASRLNESLHAKAFTVGNDVAFGGGEYQPHSSKGRWLIAHELSHVVQQQSSAPTGDLVRETSGRRVQGGFFGRAWDAITGGVKAVGGALKTAVKAVGNWGWDVLKSGAALAWRQVIQFPSRAWRLVKHLGSGVAGLTSWVWEGFKHVWHGDFKGLGKWLVGGLLSGAAWVGRLLGAIVDIAGIGEVWDLLSQLIKFNTRTLTTGETTEAKRTFTGSIAYWQVRIDEFSLIAHIASAFNHGPTGVTTFHTINFPKRIVAAPDSSDMSWLTHELTHVLQYERVGAQYLGEAIYGQSTTGYGYGGPSALWRPLTHSAPNPSGKHLRAFNREQQGDIAADYYNSLSNRGSEDGMFAPITSDYAPIAEELRAGEV